MLYKILKSFSYAINNKIYSAYLITNILFLPMFPNLFSVTVTAEPDSLNAVRMSIGVGMTSITNCSLSAVPDTVFIMQKVRLMSSRMGSLYAVIIIMAFHANRVGTLRIVT